MFCVFGLLNFFPPPIHCFLCVFVFKKTNNFIFKTTHTFPYRIRNIINYPVITSAFSWPQATCIWKFVQCQSPHLGFCWRYCHISFGYQARIFHFSFFKFSHKSLSFMTWNLIEYLHTQELQRTTAHLNIWTNSLLFCFIYGCEQHRNILTKLKRRKLVFMLCSPLHFKPFLLTSVD